LSSDIELLTERMKRVLDCDFDFKVPTRTAREKEEYINLYVTQNGKKIDVGLQGSGFLQVAEIFSSMAIMDNALNVLLIDEPDSHISPRIQNKLLDCLKEISNVQVFVITHNDNFVSELAAEDIIFINSENKNTGHIEALNDINIDVLHSSLGGVITGLTRLQKNKRIIFTEGDDDIAYLKAMNEAFKRVNSPSAIDFSKISFWYIRGKDNMNLKIMANKQLLSQAVQGCKYAVIFDKDYSTEDTNTKFINSDILRRLGNSSWAHTHNGYCIESVLFSEMDKLKKFLNKITGKDEETINTFLDEYFYELKQSLSNVQSNIYFNMKEKFKSQKKPTRPELDNVEFDIYAGEAAQNIHYAMNKDNIRAFVLKIEEEWGITLFQREDDASETFASGLLNKYIDSIEAADDIYNDYVILFQKIRDFIV
jgi:energy-coupling factor transporter ATP-binding protein EcfA2